MRRCFLAFALAIVGVAMTAEAASAGPILRRIFGDRSSSVAVSRSRTYSFGARSSGGCANGQCASASASAAKPAAQPAAQPAPKKKQ